jgi:lysozyme
MNVQPNYEQLGSIKGHFEGYENLAYKDSGGVWTVGYGSTYNHDKKRKVKQDDFVNREIATRWMAIDVANITTELNRYIKVPLNPYQSAALVDYCYNRGIGNMLKTQLDELINANPNDLRIKGEFLKTGLKDRVGNLLWGLGRRRRAQAYLYFTGKLKFDWPRWGAAF